MPDSAVRARPLRRETPLGESLTVVVPEHLRAPCQHLLDGLVGRGACVVDDREDSDVHSGDVLLIGALETNRWVRTLYLRSWVATDVLHPGPGGYELKTLCGPFHAGANVLLLGASDEIGLNAGATRLDELTRHLDAAPCLFEVSASDAVVRSAQRWEGLLTPEGFAPYRGSWDGLMLMAGFGAHAVFTGRMDFAQACKRECLAQLRLGAREGYHAFFGLFVLFFRALEQLPVWADDERTEVIASLRELIPTGEGLGFIRDVADDQSSPRQNHQTRCALSGFYVADYFQRFLRDPQADEWMDLVDRFFAPMLRSSKPICDTSGHQWKASIHDVAAYAMARGRNEYFSSGVFFESALRALQNMSNLGQQAVVSGPGAAGWGPWTIFAMAAAVYDDPSFMAHIRRWYPDLSILLEPRLCGDETLRSFAVAAGTAREPDELVGAFASPLARLYYDGAHKHTPGMYAATRPAYERTVDKVSFRSGFEPRDDYVLIDGVSGGSHSYEDVGAVKEVDLLGCPWICAIDAGYREACIATQNAVLVLKDGQRSVVPQFAELLRMEGDEAGGQCSLRVSPYSGARWTRHVFWQAREYLAVIDEIEALEPGDFQVEARWHVLGDAHLDGGHVTSHMPAGNGGGTVNFSLGWMDADRAFGERLDFRHEFHQYWAVQNKRERPLFGRDDVPGNLLRTRLVRKARLDTGDRLALGTLMYAFADDDPEWRLAEGGTRWRAVRPGESHDLLQATAPAPRRHPGSRILPTRTPPTCGWRQGCAFGTTEGTVIALDRDGSQRWDAPAGDCVNGLAAGSDFLVAGADDGSLTVLNADGTTRWTRRTSHHFVEESDLAWAYWRPTIRRVAVLSGLGDQPEIVLAGLGDGYLHAFDARSGDPLWKHRLQWGLCSVLDTIVLDDRPCIVAGTGQPSIHSWLELIDCHGSHIRRLARPIDCNWGMATEATTLVVCDMDGDGRAEIVHGTANHVRHLACWRPDGTLLWEIDTGEKVTHLAALPGLGALAASRSGWLFHVSPTGDVAARVGLDAPVLDVAAHRGSFWALAPGGELYRIADSTITKSVYGNSGRGLKLHGAAADATALAVTGRGVFAVDAQGRATRVDEP